MPPPQGPQGDGRGGPKTNIDAGGGYTTDEDGASFDSDRRFSNFILFTGAFALAILFMASSVMHLKKEKDAKQNQAQNANS